MKKNKIILIIIIILFVILGGLYLLFKGTSWFISSFDGNVNNSNYTTLMNGYYLFKTERTICMETDGNMDRVTSVVDSLNWNDQIIVGFSQGKYFVINSSDKKLTYFESKDSLTKVIGLIPQERAGETIPRISKD